MTTQTKVIFDAVNELVADDEFARSIELQGSASRIVDYLVRRGVAETEAELLGLAYFAGRLHAGSQFDIIVKRLGAKS